jgi:hypothetical protein
MPLTDGSRAMKSPGIVFECRRGVSCVTSFMQLALPARSSPDWGTYDFTLEPPRRLTMNRAVILDRQRLRKIVLWHTYSQLSTCGVTEIANILQLESWIWLMGSKRLPRFQLEATKAQKSRRMCWGNGNRKVPVAMVLTVAAVPAAKTTRASRLESRGIGEVTLHILKATWSVCIRICQRMTHAPRLSGT